MQIYPPTLVIRHRKENLKKCSLRGLEIRSDMTFLTYPFAELPPVDQYMMLVMDGAPEISVEDQYLGLLLLDSTWKYLPKMVNAVESQAQTIKRTLPSHFKTAYPRDQGDCSDPTRGLASIEALYISYLLLGRSVENLLDNYYWKNEFLKKNSNDVSQY